MSEVITVSLNDEVLKALDEHIEKKGGSRSSFINKLIVKELNVQMGHHWREVLCNVLKTQCDSHNLRYTKSIREDDTGVDTIIYRLHPYEESILECSVTIHKYYIDIDFGVQSTSKKVKAELKKCYTFAKNESILQAIELKEYSRRTAIIWHSSKISNLSNKAENELIRQVLGTVSKLMQIFNQHWTLD